MSSEEASVCSLHWCFIPMLTCGNVTLESSLEQCSSTVNEGKPSGCQEALFIISKNIICVIFNCHY